MSTSFAVAGRFRLVDVDAHTYRTWARVQDNRRWAGGLTGRRTPGAAYGAGRPGPRTGG